MSSRPRRSNLLSFHRPTLHLERAPIPVLKPESKQCLQTLLHYRPPKQRVNYPKSRSAAVLVALFVGRYGDLYVLLSRRASTLRTYAGDTSLPGGKWEPRDRNLEQTARREAFEEIGLPIDNRKVPLLCILEPFIAGSPGQLIVTPVVVLVLDKTIKPILNTPEVASLFSHPLAALLHSEPPFATEQEMLELKYHTHHDVDWRGRGKVRMHRFLTGREAGGTKPIFGFTAGVLIRVATIGYGREPDFDVYTPDQPSQEERIAFELQVNPILREACRTEGIDPDKAPEPSSLRTARRSDGPRGHRRRAVRSKL
ncbi:NUDIX hydrolase domain-like protein [Rhodofomes roseus]|uniref:NUDIX hydrolase domain-like protein n=1 Tax=Rhodofomes roseus TaxID=34475 RepID=A0ABQ8KA41_9APHY|nr:NUDIX hydrolase domain-like protein [Rhodofomes roseus]KAH9833854.1 NUDIX hydrolase domain-like protein [Rhodofomes roseus]